MIRFMETSLLGSPIDDYAILEQLPADISDFLRRRNGFITANGGFHVRGAWEGEYALHHLYPDVSENDIRLAEDCFGDQYLLRDALVIRLVGETGDIEAMECDWTEFMTNIKAAPIEYLNLGFLECFQTQLGPLAPGYLINAYRPFVAAECHNPTLRPIPSLELRSFHADFAKQIRNIPDGGSIRIKVG